MMASLLSLSRENMRKLKVTDTYSIHRVVYSLFEDVRSDIDKRGSVSSGILYADKGGDRNARKILILSARSPIYPEEGQLEVKIIPDSFLEHNRYVFEVIVNPTKRDNTTGKLIGIRGDSQVLEWFMHKAPLSWGFSVETQSFEMKNFSIQRIEKKNHRIIQAQACLKGKLEVIDRPLFIRSFQSGIGRGHAFGCGLLQIVPLVKS